MVEEKHKVFFFNHHPHFEKRVPVLERSIDKPLGEGNAKSRGGADRGPPSSVPKSSAASSLSR
jgi:hypothetical protein